MYSLITEHPVAVDSIDHLYPMGAIRDNFSNTKFNEKVVALTGKRVSVLDLGCSGGGSVKSFIDSGHKAVGLEGSDKPLIAKRAEWAEIPDNLFTCDITKEFSVLEDGIQAKFDLITAWDVLEHIKEEDLPIMLTNVKNHLVSGGMFITTISNETSPNEYTPGIEMHATIKDWDWWIELFARNGFINDSSAVEYIQPDWVRLVSRAFVWRINDSIS